MLVDICLFINMPNPTQEVQGIAAALQQSPLRIVVETKHTAILHEVRYLSRELLHRYQSSGFVMQLHSHWFSHRHHRNQLHTQSTKPHACAMRSPQQLAVLYDIWEEHRYKIIISGQVHQLKRSGTESLTYYILSFLATSRRRSHY